MKINGKEYDQATVEGFFAELQRLFAPPEEKRWFFDLETLTLSSIPNLGMAGQHEKIEVQESDLPYLEKPEGEYAEYSEFRKTENGDACLVCKRDGNRYVHGGKATVCESDVVVLEKILRGYRWCKPRKAEGRWEEIEATSFSVERDGRVILCDDDKGEILHISLPFKARFWVTEESE